MYGVVIFNGSSVYEIWATYRVIHISYSALIYQLYQQAEEKSRLYQDDQLYHRSLCSGQGQFCYKDFFESAVPNESELFIVDHLECLPFSKRFNALLSEITFFHFIVNWCMWLWNFTLYLVSKSHFWCINVSNFIRCYKLVKL